MTQARILTVQRRQRETMKTKVVPAPLIQEEKSGKLEKDNIHPKKTCDELKAKAGAKLKSHRKVFSESHIGWDDQTQTNGTNDGDIPRRISRSRSVGDIIGAFSSEKEYEQAKRECQTIQRRLHRAKRRILIEIEEEQKEAKERAKSYRALHSSDKGGIALTAGVLQSGNKTESRDDKKNQRGYVSNIEEA